MAEKMGNGGHSLERYDISTGKYTEDGKPNKYYNNPNENNILDNNSKNNLGKELTPNQTKYFANSKMRDKNGNLKVMYRGDSEDFDTFDRSKMNNYGTFGNGFYFSEENSHAGTYGNTKEYYLNIENPINTEKKQVTLEQVYNLLKYIEDGGEDGDLDLSNYGYGVTAKSLAKKLYNENDTDFKILRDINASSYGNFAELIELFNKLNGTNYDGIISATETVVFKPNQIKLVSNENPTNSDSISDISEEKKAMKLFRL